MSVSKGTSDKKKENLPHSRRPRAEKTRSLGSIFKWSQDTSSPGVTGCGEHRQLP